MQEQPTGKNIKLGGWAAHGVLITCTLLFPVNFMHR
jgi:hypothetical protein